MTTPKQRILFKGYYDVHNFGDDLLLLALLELFQKELRWQADDVTLYIEPGEGSLDKLGYEHPYTLKHFHDPVKRFHKRFKRNGQSNALSKLTMGLFMLWSLLCARLYRLCGLQTGIQDFVSFFSGIDTIHYIGGGYFNTRLSWGTQLLVYELFLTTLGRLINPELRIIGTGLGIGPVGTAFYRNTFARFAAKFDALFVREPESERFLQSLGTVRHVECIGDDGVLLLPYFQRIRETTERTSTFALNLKSDDVHRYEEAVPFLEQLRSECRDAGETVAFFSFGRDHRALSQLPAELAQSMPVYACYDMGLESFSRKMAEAGRGLGLAYHFAILGILMNIPAVNVYFDDYYRQKTGGVVALLCEQHVIIPFSEMIARQPRELLDALSPIEPSRIWRIHDRLVSAYRATYRNLESARRNPNAGFENEMLVCQ